MAGKRTKKNPTNPTHKKEAETPVPPLRLEYRSPAELAENPANWRIHPAAQVAALTDVIAEVGWAGACLYNEATGRLIDGHARRKVALEQGAATVPVLVGDWSEEQERKILATLDPLAAMAEANTTALEALLKDVQTGSAAVGKLLTDLAEVNREVLGEAGNGEVTAADPDDEKVLDEDHDEDALDLFFKAPYPWFGGKSRVAGMVWKRFGDVKCYIEPFYGSGAVFLNRPQPFEGVETINDFDGLVCNFWRAVQADPDAVAKYADWPVNENDAHSRHAWLVARKDSLQSRLEGDPDYFDAKVAGWWVWGMACWIGSGFCSGKGPWQVVEDEDGSRQLVHLSDAGQGVNRKRVHLSDAGRGVNRKLVHLGNAGRGVKRQRVHLGDAGRGVNRQLVHLSDAGQEEDGKPGCGERGLLQWMQALSQRLKRVRVCCGDWTRVCGGDSGDALQHFFACGEPCGIFLDPPYSAEAGRDESIYRQEDLTIAHAVREWCIRHGNDPRLRIALCGYDSEHVMPASWQCVAWKAYGGMASLGHAADTRGKVNRFRERVWFSPHC